MENALSLCIPSPPHVVRLSSAEEVQDRKLLTESTQKMVESFAYLSEQDTAKASRVFGSIFTCTLGGEDHEGI
jgi:hypothetical protein